MFKGENEIFSVDESSYYYFTLEGEKISASGDVTSLLNGLGGDCELSDYCFVNLFDNCTLLTTPPELPATTLVKGCYQNMFYGCTSLTTAPELPATTLVSSCYVQMFWGCTSLTQAPQLPSTDLAQSCYQGMFAECTSLVEAPELPSTNLARSCYDYMFSYCTSLTEALQLPATNLAEYCYYMMFSGCTGLTQAPNLPATQLAKGCYQCMFQGCTSLVSAPELFATTLVNECYAEMFSGCTSLTSASCSATDISAENTVIGMFDDIKTIGNFTCPDEMRETWITTNYIPQTWTINGKETNKYLTFTSTGNSTISLNKEIIPGESSGEGGEYERALENFILNIQYSLDSGETWSDYTWETSSYYVQRGLEITLSDGESVLFRGINETFSKHLGHDEYIWSNFIITGSIAASGDITSLLNGRGRDEYLAQYCFYNLFSGCDSLTSAPNLPSTTLANYCYQNMFSGCISLTSAPNLPATNLAPGCYYSMFYNCTSLTSASCFAINNISYASSIFSGIHTTGNFTCPDEIRETWIATNYIPQTWTINGEPWEPSDEGGK